MTHEKDPQGEQVTSPARVVGEDGVDYWRQLDMFDPLHFKTPVHIIGVGATGSWIAYLLAKMGVRNMTVWDFDAVENHNLPNQIFGIQEIGMLKAEAMKKIILRDCGFEIIAKTDMVDGTQKLPGIVYVCTDTMSSRKQIWENALKLNFDVDLVVETRLAAELGLIYTVHPISMRDIDGYEVTLYADDEAEESACTYRSIGSMVAVLAGAACHKLVKFHKDIPMRPVAKVTTNKEAHESEGMLCINPIIVTTAQWTD